MYTANPHDGHRRNLFDCATAEHDAARTHTFAGLAGRAEAKGAGKAAYVTLPLGHVIGKPFEKSLLRLAHSERILGRTRLRGARAARECKAESNKKTSGDSGHKRDGCWGTAIWAIVRLGCGFGKLQA